MNPAALLKLVREVGPAQFSESRTRPGGFDPFTRQSFLPGIEESFRDPYTARLEELMAEEEIAKKTARPAPTRKVAFGAPPELAGEYRQPDDPGPLLRMMQDDSRDVEMNRYAQVPHGTYSWDEWQAMRGQPGEAPNTHGFDVYEFGEGNALEIPGLKYRSPSEKMLTESASVEREIDPTVSRMEETEAALRAHEEEIANAKSWEDIPGAGEEGPLSRILGMSWGPRQGKGVPAKFNQDVARLDFRELPEGKKASILSQMDFEATRSADMPSEQGEFAANRSKRLKDDPKPVIAGARFDKFTDAAQKRNTPYAGLLEAIASGAVRGSFTDNLPPELRVGSRFPLRVHPRSAIDVMVKGVHAYDPEMPLAERLRLLEMMGRGAQDQGMFNKPGTVIEWDALESVPLKPGTKVEPGAVVPVERKNGKTVQMEVVHIKGDGKSMLVKPVFPEEDDARATLRFAAAEEAGKNSRSEMSNVLNLHELLSPAWQKFFDSRSLVREDGRATLKPTDKLAPETPRSRFDLKRAQTFTLKSKSKPDDNYFYWAGARAVPLDKEARKWVVVNVHQQGKATPKGTQGIDLVEVDDRGMATVTKYGPDAKILKGDDGQELRFQIPIVLLFKGRQLDDMIIPNLPKWKRKVKARDASKPLPEQPASITAEGAAAQLAVRMKRAEQLNQGAPRTVGETKPANVKFDSEGEAFESTQRGRQDFARVEPEVTRNAATERAAAMMIRDLQEMKTSRYLPADDLESNLRARLEADPQAPGRRAAREVLEQADVPTVRDDFVDRVIAKLQGGERLSGDELDIVSNLVRPAVLNAYMRKGAAEFIKDSPGSSRPNMMSGSKKKNPRDITEGRTPVYNWKGPIEKDAEGLPTVKKAPRQKPQEVQEGSPIKPAATYRGKPSKQGLLRTEGPKRQSGLRMVEKYTVDDIKRNPDVIFIVPKDVDATNAVNINDPKVDVSKLLRGNEIVISKGVVDKLTPAQKDTLRKLFPGKNKKIEAGRELQRRANETSEEFTAAKKAREKRRTIAYSDREILPEEELIKRREAKQEGIQDQQFGKRKEAWEAGSEKRETIAAAVRNALASGKKLTKGKKGKVAERTELDIVNNVLAVLRKNK